MIGFALLNDILFIGLGLFGAEMPQMVEAAGRMSGADTVVEARTSPEGPLNYQWQNAAAGPGVDPRLALASGRPEQLVMTEALPLEESVVRHASVDYAARFRNLALRHNPRAQAFMYEGWPALPPGGLVHWRQEIAATAALWRSLVDAVNDQTRGPVDAPPMRLIPLAQGLVALGEAIDRGQVPGVADVSQLFADDRQLNGRGTYFAAMLFHAALTGNDPTGLPVWLGRNRPATLDEAVTGPMAEAMQQIARQVVQDERAASGVDVVSIRHAQMLVGDSLADVNARTAWHDASGSYLTGIQRPGVGFNLTQINDWSTEQPFLDVFKTARPWIGHLSGQWGGMDDPGLREAGHLDQHGWPLRIPPEATHLSTLIFSGLDARMISMAGRYVLRYRGSGRIELEGRVRNLSQEAGRIAFDYTPGEGSVTINLRAIDPSDPIRQISVVRQDRLALADAGQIFNPDFLARLRGAEVLRFMEWMRTNNSKMTSASQLPAVDDYVWSSDRGVPPEVMVALANELDLDPWFTLPHLADDELVREYARRVRDNLRPGRRAWVEFSNEIWNWSFDQRHWADSAAEAAWGVTGAGIQYGAWRAAQVADIWAEEFAPSTKGRLVRVVGTFAGYAGAEDEMLTAPAWQAADPAGWRPLADHFDAYAITGYFHANLEDADRLALVRAAMAESRVAAEGRAAELGLVGDDAAAFVRRHRFDDVILRAVQDLRDGGLTGQPEGTVQWTIDNVFRHHRRAASRYGLDLVMYEGGTHVVASGAAADDEELTEFLIALNYSAGMGELYRQLMAGWRAVSDQPFTFYTAIGGPSRHGSWGTLRFLDDSNPRWDAVSEPAE